MNVASDLVYTNPLIAIGAIMTLIALVAAAVAIGRSSLVQAQLAGLRADRDDQEHRIERLEGDNQRLTVELASETNARQVLERLVTGREQLDRIIKLLQQHEGSTKTANDSIIKALKDLKQVS
jgi:hypothetical protein